MFQSCFSRFLSRVAAGAGLAAILAVASWAGTAQVIYSLGGDEDGEYADSDLVVDSSGNIFGTTVLGGTFGSGTVFELVNSGGTWTHQVLYNFTGGADGGQPYKGVTLDSAGNLYGTAVEGGTGGTCVESGCGVAYKLTNNGGTWTQTVIHNFTGGNDGYGPGSGLSFDKAGNLYGMTPTGGAHGLGVIYQLVPNTDGTWKLRVIHAFTGGTDGGTGSAGRLFIDSDGNLFGVATVGGANGAGTAYKVTPGTNGRWRLTTLYAFKGSPDAGFPYGGLTFDSAGNLYGTTYYDGANDLGAVYELSPKSDGTWRERVIHSFAGGADGNSPISTLVSDLAGNLYGTTSEGGAAACGCGTVFKLTKGANGTWKESVAYQFQGSPDGAFVYNGMATDRNGDLYGATVHGGSANEGSVYKFTP